MKSKHENLLIPSLLFFFLAGCLGLVFLLAGANEVQRPDASERLLTVYEQRIRAIPEPDFERRRVNLYQHSRRREQRMGERRIRATMSAGVRDATGNWAGPELLGFRIEQAGSEFSITGYVGPKMVLSGMGTVIGGEYSLWYETIAATEGHGTLILSEDGSQMEGTLRDDFTGLRQKTTFNKAS